MTGLGSLLEPWAALYGESTTLQSAVVFLHLSGLLMGGGGAVAEDLGTLRAARGDPQRRAERLKLLGMAHRTVLAGLGVTAATGVLMLGADFAALATSGVFWIKMALVVALLANGALLMRAEARARDTGPAGDRAWQTLAGGAGVSAFLWFLILFVSVLLTQTA